MNKLLTIVTINYNNYDNLRKTLQSLEIIRNYEHKIQLIFVDGGSNDGSVELMRDFIFENKIIINGPDTGIYNAMNKSIKHINGKYVWFVNSGDEINSLNCDQKDRLFSEMESCKFDFIYSDFIAIDNELSYLKKQILIIDFFYLFKSTINHQTLITKSIFFQNKIFDDINYKIVSDWIFLFEIFIENKITYFKFDFPLTKFDINGLSGKDNTWRIERDNYLNAKYSSWELESFELASRIRSKNYWSKLINMLDRPRLSKLFFKFIID